MALNILKKMVLITLCGIVIFSNGCEKNQGRLVVTTNSEEAREYFNEGWKLLDNLRTDDAREYFDKAVELDSNFALAYLLNAQAQISNKERRENIKKAMDLAETTSKGEQFMIRAANAGLSNDFEQQIELMAELAKIYSHDERLVQQLGNYYFGQQQYDSALSVYLRVLEINDRYPPPYNMMGYLYRYRGNNIKAEESFKKYIELIPEDPNPYDSYAELLMKMGKYGLSIESYYKALEIDPTFVPSHLGIAYNLCLLNKHKEAREQIREMMQNAENDGQKRQALMAIAITYIDEGQLEKAIKYFEKRFMISKDNNDNNDMAGDLSNIGLMYLEMGKYDLAEEKYNEAFELMSNFDLNTDEFLKNITRNMLLINSRLTALRGNLDKAGKMAEDYRQQVEESGNPFELLQSHRLTGQIELLRGNYDLAITELVRSNLRNPYNLYLIGTAYEGKGSIDKAREYFDRAANFNTFTTTPINYSLIRKRAELKLIKLELSYK